MRGREKGVWTVMTRGDGGRQFVRCFLSTGDRAVGPGSACPGPSTCVHYPSGVRYPGHEVRIERDLEVAMPIQFAVLASGSRGNSTLVQAGHAGLLIDFGLGPKALAARLEGVGSGSGRIAAVVLTHTHGDHVHPATVRLLAAGRSRSIATRGTGRPWRPARGSASSTPRGWSAITTTARSSRRRGSGSSRSTLSHDGGPTFGFRVEGRPDRGARPVALGYMADTGCWSEAMADAMADVDVLGVEFNHDVTLQRNSGRCALPDRPEPGRPRPPLQRPGGRAGLGRPRAIGAGHGPPRGPAPPERPVQPARPGGEGGPGAVRAAGRRVAVHAARQSQAFPEPPGPPGPAPTGGLDPAFPWEAA